MDTVWIVLISIAGFLILMYASIFLKWFVWAWVWLIEALACVGMVIFFPITIYCRRPKRNRGEYNKDIHY